MKIRMGSLQDAAELARLRWDSSEPEQQVGSQAEFVQDYTEWLQGAMGSGDWAMFVVEDDGGRLVANLYLERVRKAPRPGNFERAWGYVTNMYAEPATRNQGVGSRLLQYAVDWAYEQKLELLLLWPSERAVPFYERAGFVRCHEAMERTITG